MRIGLSDRRVEVQRYTTTTNTYGERQLNWATYITVWAELMKTGISMDENITGHVDQNIAC